MTEDLDQLDEEVGTRLITIVLAQDGSLTLSHPDIALWECAGSLTYSLAMIEDAIQNEVETEGGRPRRRVKE